MLSEGVRRFLAEQPVGRLATADGQGRPHVVPVCFVVDGGSLYVTVDRKPKRAGGRALKRERNVRDNAAVAFVADVYDDDWQALAWVMLRGEAVILAAGDEHDRAQALLRERYVQYRTMDLAPLPVIAMRIEQVNTWGRLAAVDRGGAPR